MRIHAAIVLSVALAAFAVPAWAGAVPAMARKQIDAVNAAWVPSLKAGDVDRAAAGFAPDCVFVGVDGSVTLGRAALEDKFRKRLAGGLKITGGWVKQAGEQKADSEIVEWGHSMLRAVDASGKARDIGGLYVAIWRQDRTGAWKIVRNLSFP